MDQQFSRLRPTLEGWSTYDPQTSATAEAFTAVYGAEVTLELPAPELTEQQQAAQNEHID